MAQDFELSYSIWSCRAFCFRKITFSVKWDTKITEKKSKSFFYLFIFKYISFGVATASGGIQVISEGVDLVDKTITLYNKVMDSIVQWDKVDATVQQLTDYKTDYSKEAAEIIGRIHTLSKYDNFI